MMRGITVALWFGSGFTAGSAFAGLVPNAVPCVIGWLYVLLLAFLGLSIWSSRKIKAATRRLVNVSSIVVICLVLTTIGFLTGGRLAMGARLELFAAVLLLVAASFRFLNAYYFFAREFAKSVWLHFASEPTERVPAK